MWNPHTSDCGTCTHKGGRRPIKSRGNRGRPKSVLTVDDMLCLLSPSKPVPKAVQQCISHVLSHLPNCLIN